MSTTAGSGEAHVSTQDLQIKYNKLAAEYAKLRSQLMVLKRAYVDEQATGTTLRGSLQLQEQSVRKLEQEVDSLNFRNKQLEKRIGVLQSELSNHQGHQGHGHGGHKTTTGHPYIDLSIEENFRLQRQLSDLEEAKRIEIEKLHEELRQQKEIVLKAEKVVATSTSGSSGVGGGEPQQKMEDTREVDSDEEESPREICSLERLKESEQQREHWMTEYQLVKMKYDRMAKKWEESKEVLKSLGRDDLLSPSTEAPPDDPSEALKVKEYLTAKVNELICLLQVADSRATHYYNECKSMESLLNLSHGKIRQLEGDIMSMELKQSDLDEDFRITKENYETQLNQLTEHLALLNEKIADKQEIINQLQGK